MNEPGPSSGALDATHDPAIISWVDGAAGHPDFPVQNLPFGVFLLPTQGRHGEDKGADDGGDDGTPRGGIRIGDSVLDMRALARSGLLAGVALAGARAASGPTLNDFFALGAPPRKALRARLHSLLSQVDSRPVVAPMLHHIDAVDMKLPAAVGDYTDFYAGIQHAVAVGSLFRPDRPLLPNYPWVPVAYHGRASSVRVSGEPVRRPRGQYPITEDGSPTFAPTRKLDFELELGVWIGQGNEAGTPVPVGASADRVAGYCLLNDWSARDIQSWEYQPLGPFLGKNFATTVSPWVITPEALAPFRTVAPGRRPGDPAPLPYLTDPADQVRGGLDIELEVLLRTAAMRSRDLKPERVSVSSTRHLYWTIAQLIAHHTSGGCNLRPGDLLGTGTISGPDDGSRGSLLEMTRNGSAPFSLPSGEVRSFLQDGDEVILRARATRPGWASVGFGECSAVVLPALDPAPSGMG